MRRGCLLCPSHAPRVLKMPEITSGFQPQPVSQGRAPGEGPKPTVWPLQPGVCDQVQGPADGALAESRCILRTREPLPQALSHTALDQRVLVSQGATCISEVNITLGHTHPPFLYWRGGARGKMAGYTEPVPFSLSLGVLIPAAGNGLMGLAEAS